MIAIVDYGVGNTASVLNMFRHIGTQACVTSDPSEIRAASGIVLPGVGSFDTAMERLAAGPLIDAIRDAVSHDTPLLGICLGMQLLLDGSDEGVLPGLGLIAGRCKRFETNPDNRTLRIPHMGWNTVQPSTSTTSPLLPASPSDSDGDGGPAGDTDMPWRFYFVHSYHAVCQDEENVLATTTYGTTFTCAIAKGNIMGVQFHPEKSHKFGKQMLKNFANLTCST